MSGQPLTRESIEEWAYSDIVIDAYESGDDGGLSSTNLT